MLTNGPSSSDLFLLKCFSGSRSFTPVRNAARVLRPLLHLHKTQWSSHGFLSDVTPQRDQLLTSVSNLRSTVYISPQGPLTRVSICAFSPRWTWTSYHVRTTPSVGSSAACPLASPWLCGSSAFSPHLPSPQPAGDCSLNLQCSVKMPSPLSGLLLSPHDPKHMDYFLLWASILSGCLSIWHISILNISRLYSECTFSLTQIGCEVCEGRSKLLMG